MTLDVVTFGCRLNIAEAETIERHAKAAGLDDLVVVNTCAVTAEAVRQARQAIRRLKRERPGARVVVTGCAAQIAPDTFAAMPEVAGVVGNGEKMRPETWTALLDPGGSASAVADIMTATDAPLPRLDGARGRTRAFVPVQTGCDHRCTFCVIPYGRGPSRSVPMGAAVEAVRAQVEGGAREVVLTGVDVTSYGPDLPGQTTLGALVRAILRHVPELERLRLSSLDSVEVDDDLLDALATDARLMPHLHLSLQAGDDLILKRMKRRHGRADAIRFCETVRRIRPDVVFGADIIAGFPTEDEAAFGRSLALVEDCGLTHLHVFPYSPRPGTPAARMPQVPGAVIRERAARLRERGAAAYRRHLESEVGMRRRVLTEQGGRGRTEGFTPVRLPDGVPAGELLTLTIAGQDGRELWAA